MQKYAGVEAALDAIPIFPLPQVVLFPGGLLPLHIFEPRYRTMLADALVTHGAIAMVRLRDGAAPNADGTPAIETIGGAGVILEHQALGSGRSNIILLGQARVRLEELPFDGTYRRARATVLPNEGPGASEDEAYALRHAIQRIVGAVQIRDAGFHFEVPNDLDAGATADLAAHHLIVSVRMRQELLGATKPRDRVRLVTAELIAQMSGLQHATRSGVLH